MAQPANRASLPWWGAEDGFGLVFGFFLFVIFLLCPKLYVILLNLGGGEVKFQALTPFS